MARFMSSVQNDLKEVVSSKIPAEQVRHLVENDQSSKDLFMGDSVFGCDQSIRCRISCYVGESENIQEGDGECGARSGDSGPGHWWHERHSCT